jgi:hypothetical protein
MGIATTKSVTAFEGVDATQETEAWGPELSCPAQQRLGINLPPQGAQ